MCQPSRVAVLGNYPWELAQAPLYVGMESFRAVWWHCFVASLGDGLLVLGICAIGWLLLRRHTWFVHPGIGVCVAAERKAGKLDLDVG
jgi:hypothetical protein